MTEPHDPNNEQRLLEAARRLRREHERSLDELTVARLRATRLNATAERPRRGPFGRLAIGAIAAGLALAVAGVVWLESPAPVTPAAEPTVADLDLLETEGPEFYSNLEFYTWLASQSDAS